MMYSVSVQDVIQKEFPDVSAEMIKMAIGIAKYEMETAKTLIRLEQEKSVFQILMNVWQTAFSDITSPRNPFLLNVIIMFKLNVLYCFFFLLYPSKKILKTKSYLSKVEFHNCYTLS